MTYRTKKLIYAALFLVLALVLPFLTGQLPQIGTMLTPMHFPILICGYICGWQWGLAVGFVAPLLRSLIFGMPFLFPNALCMAFELAVYGGVSGILYRRLPPKNSSVYLSLIPAMICGRLVWGLVRFLCTGLDATSFGLSAFWAGAVTMSIPGILLQILLVPPLVILMEKALSKQVEGGRSYSTASSEESAS